MKKIGLAISGGGIKSFAAIGVLRHLKELSISPKFFSGTSMGSVIASFLAMDLPIDTIEKELFELENIFQSEKIVSPTLKGILSISSGYADPEIVEAKLSEVYKAYQVINISDVKKPLVVTSVDITTGKLVLFTNRKERFQNQKEMIIIDDVPLATAIMASCCFPLVFRTKKWNDMELVDGGVRENLPVQPLRVLGAEMILSVSMQNLIVESGFDSVISVGKRVMDLMLAQSTLYTIPLSDLNINVELETDNPFEFTYGKTAVEKGYEESKKQAHLLKEFKKKSERLIPFLKK